MPSRFNIPAPPYVRLTYGVTEKVKAATCRIVVQACRLLGDKRPGKAEERWDLEATADGD